MQVLHFLIPDMGCQNCAAAIREELEKISGVTNISLNPETKEAVVEISDSKTDQKTVFAAVTAAGFTPQG